jgi:hypothetical protein
MLTFIERGTMLEQGVYNSKEVIKEYSLDTHYKRLQRILSNYNLDGASFSFFIPDIGCPISANWNLPFDLYKINKKKWANGINDPGAVKKFKSKLNKTSEKKSKKTSIGFGDEDEFPIVVTFPRNDHNRGVIIDENSEILKSIFKKPKYAAEFIGDIYEFKQDVAEDFRVFFNRNYSGEIERKFTSDKCEYYQTKDFAMVADVWKNDDSTGILLFELMDDLYMGTTIENKQDSMLHGSFMSALQELYKVIPFVRFPGKSYAQLVATFFRGVMRHDIDITPHVDLIALGSTNNGKTTAIRHLIPDKEKIEAIETTHYFDVYFTKVAYGSEDSYYNERAIGGKGIGIVIWDFGGQRKFWDRVLGRTNCTLPEKLLPKLRTRQPQVYLLTYAADKEETLSELNEQIGQCKEAIGGDAWQNSYKILVRTKTDKGVKILDGELKLLAATLGADDYIQVNTVKDKDIIVRTFKKGFYHAIERDKSASRNG